MKGKSNDVYRLGEFSLCPGERRLFKGQQNVALPPKAFDCLELLVRRDGGLVTRSELFAALWPGIHVSEANLTNIVVTLRKVLGRDALQTVSKHGYRLMLPVTGEPGIDHEAYASFIRGKELLAQRSPDAVEKARNSFWFSLAHDPKFAAAWAWLGRACRLLEKFGCHSDSNGLAEAAFQRAFAIDAHLACAHQFYTQFQVDTGRAAQALVRLVHRLKNLGKDPETFAGLVQVFRYCGLLQESLDAHQQAVCLDPAIRTSVAHTHFVRAEFPRVFETYTGALYYLDAAAWAALGARDRAALLLRERVAQPALGKTMMLLMSSLLAVLDGKAQQAVDLMNDSADIQDPEVLFYLARHFAMLGNQEGALQMLGRARLAGFWSSYSLRNDPVFSMLQRHSQLQREIEEADRLEAHCRSLLQRN